MIVQLGKNVLRAALFGAGSISLLELYSRVPFLDGTPGQVSIPDTITSSSSSKVHILFPGFGGADLNTDRIIKKINENSHVDEVAFCYDWIEWRGNIIRASFNGQVRELMIRCSYIQLSVPSITYLL